MEDPAKVTEACPSLLIWVEFELVNPEVDRDLNVVSCATSWLIKTSWELACGWVQAAVNASLPEGMVPPALPLPQETILEDRMVFDKLRPVFKPLFSGRLLRDW